MKSLARNRLSPARTLGATALAFVLVAALAPSGPAQAGPATNATATVYTVQQEGLTANDGAKLADSFAVGNALYDNGRFQYIDNDRFQFVPQTTVGEGKDENGNPTVSQAVDLAALDRIQPYPDDKALARGRQLVTMALLSEGMTATARVSHAQFSLTDDGGKVVREKAIDTEVSYDLALGGLPVTGQGASLRLSLNENGVVTELTESLRKLAASRTVDVITTDEARTACQAVYGGLAQLDPTLGYQMPELSAVNASGSGTVKEVWPQYTCHPVGQDTEQASRLVPAVKGSGPTFKMSVKRSGDAMSGASSVSGGLAPYTYRWSSSSTGLTANTGASIDYRRAPRDGSKAERVTLDVTDANGLTATAYVDLDTDGSTSTVGAGGGGSFALAARVGIEQTVDEWQCAQDSANGFKSVMQSKGQTVAFDWRGYAAFEKDFKTTALGGWDSTYVDSVDAQWYTGHGNPNLFSFKSSVDDHYITPTDLRLGDNYNLEWLQLESCQVLRGVSSYYDFITRWGQAFRGMHMMNGFHTNAYCVGGGTGGTFATYLFPYKFLWWTLRPAYRVQQAWAAMALAKEPHGVVYRSFGPAMWNGSGWVTNWGDYFWGQGWTGPDINPTGYWWSVTGTV